MNSNLVEQTTKFLSRPTSTLKEKSLKDSEIEDLIDKTEVAVEKILKDRKRDEEDRETAKEVRKWIRDVRTTWDRDGSLHPSTVVSLQKTHTGVNSGRYGWSVPGGKVPDDFRG